MFDDTEYAVIWEVYATFLSSTDHAELQERPFSEVSVLVKQRLGELITENAPRWPAKRRNKVITYLLDELFGLGPLETLLSSPRISEIRVESAELVRIILDGRLTDTRVRFRDTTHLERIAQRASGGSREAAMPGGARFERRGEGFVIRKST